MKELLKYKRVFLNRKAISAQFGKKKQTNKQTKNKKHHVREGATSLPFLLLFNMKVPTPFFYSLLGWCFVNREEKKKNECFEQEGKFK